MSLLQSDKTSHLIVGFAIVLLCAVAAALFVPKAYAVLLGAYSGWHLTRAMAYIKEAYDLARPERHTSDMLDAEVTISGASLALALVGITVLCVAAVEAAP